MEKAVFADVAGAFGDVALQPIANRVAHGSEELADSCFGQPHEMFDFEARAMGSDL